MEEGLIVGDEGYIEESPLTVHRDISSIQVRCLRGDSGIPHRFDLVGGGDVAGIGGLVGVGDDGKGNEADAESDVDVAIHIGGFRSALHGCIGSGNKEWLRGSDHPAGVFMVDLITG